MGQIGRLFEDADRNRDGVVDEREMIEAMERMLPPPRPPGGGPAR
jgi:hypothetical protein